MDRQRQSEGQKFIGDIIWIGLSQGLMSLTGLVILPAITKGYPPEYYGLWSQMVVTVGLLSIVLTIKFDSATIRFLSAEDDRETRRRNLGTLLWPVLALIALGIAISLSLQRDLSVLLFSDPQYASFVPQVFLWASLESLFLFFSSYLRARGKIRRLSVIRLSSAVGRMAIVAVLALTNYDFLFLVWGVIGVHAMFVAWLFSFIIRDAGLPGFYFGGLKNYMGYSTPMIPGALLSWIVYASDRFFITHFLNITQTGIYGASCAIANLINLLDWPIGMVLFPQVSRLWEQKEPARVKTYIHYSMKLFLVLAIPAVGGLFVLSQPLLNVLSTSEFVVSRTLVLLLAMGSMFSGIVLINEYPIFLVRKTKYLPVVSLTGAAINIGLNVFLIPRVGIMGAAISTVISYSVLAMIMMVWSRKLIRYGIDYMFILKVVAATTIMVIGLGFIELERVPGIVVLTCVGVTIYGVFLIVLRVFSREEIALIKHAISSFRTIISEVA